MIKVDLKSIVNIQAGYQAKAKIKEKIRGTHCLIQSKDFDNSHRLQIENLTTFIPERNPEIYSVKKNDILFQARGIGHFAHYIEDDLKDTLAAGSFYIMRIQKEDLLPQFLAWWLNQSEAQSYFQSQAGGTGISFISKHTLSRLQVRIQPLSIQKKVVKIVTLANHEQFLLARIAQMRSLLAKAACLNAIQEQEI